jgi:uncharacterized damage-inducible protein DinB
MAEHPTQPEMLADLHESQQALLTFLDQVDDTTLYRRFIAEEWTLAENLVHVAEARQFFTSEVRKVLATPGASIGRGLDHPARLQNIAEHGHAARPFISQQLTNSYEQVVHLLEQMSQDDLQKMGTHMKYGPQTLAAFIQHFIIEHDQAHVKQVKTLLAQHRGGACTSEQQNS